ncbi:hypothetical protein DCV66_22930 [Salmonella enterica subsp. enterica serovar Schwarzengrund]|nr:hypothetical protein [Salmonella enterica subsp. enterica serovar Schwarzengrund]EAA0585537.1 hypothetical protein [Salmonella enterica subsp. enterica serovar Newport]EBH8985490.1 hypothetical protein [Salmonella enterica subsp. enterica serovar Gallinarum]EBC9119807.1 hypothetical protein [Salmonella enterica subsp. enterica serovar Newport]EBE3476266.1 hypothetical protein [Salmonella enterica subsp. enterica serovar Schwarzengrund]
MTIPLFGSYPSHCFILSDVFHQSATTKNLFCHKAGGSSFSGCQCYFPTYWLGLYRCTAVMQKLD